MTTSYFYAQIRTQAKSLTQAVLSSAYIRISILAIAFAQFANAQTNIANYTFTSATGATYTPITGGTVFATSYDNDLSAAITMGGTFPFGGVNFTTCYISGNGYITFGAAPSGTNYTPMSVLNSTTGAIAGFGQDGASSTATGASSEIRYLNTGTEFVVQYKDHANYYNRSTEKLNFQIRLTYATGVINIVYGTCTAPGTSASGNPVHVGIRGNSVVFASNVNSLYAQNVPASTTCNWADAVTSYANSSGLIFSSTTNASVNIPTGLKYTWTPGTQAPVRTFAAPASITSSGATVSWTAPAGATQYNVRYRIPGACSWTNWSGNPVSTTSVALTGLAASTVYQVEVQAVNGAATSIWSNILGTTATGDGYSSTGTFTTLAAPCTTPTAQPTALNLTSITSTALSGSFTAASPAPNTYLVVRSTSSTLSAGPVDATTYTAGTALGGGTVVQVSSATTFSQTGLTPNTTYYYFVFSVNSTCSGGPKYLATSPLTGNAKTCLAAPVSSAASAATFSSFQANWAAVTGATGYVLDVSTSSSFASFLTGYNALAVGNVTSYSVTGLNPSTTYYYRVRATGASSCESVSSSTQNIMTGYCASNSSSTTYYITNFATTGGASMNIANNSNAQSASGYGDFTSQVVNQIAGGSVNFSSTFAGGYSYGFAIFVDWNNDLDFVDAGETMFTTSSYVYSASGSFSVPAGQASGSYRMRVVANYSSTAPVSCNTSIYGETEDYTFTVVTPSGCSGTPTAGITVSSTTNICTSGTVNLSLSGASALLSGLTYQWRSSADGTTYADIASATAATYTSGTLTSTTWFQCVVGCSNSGNSATSTAVTVNVATPAITSTTPASRCGTGTVILGATANAGNTVSWYPSASGGALLGTGNTFTTPSIAATTNYWVQTSVGTLTATGRLAPASTPGAISYAAGLTFNCTQAFTLSSVDIYPTGAASTVNIQLQTSTGTVLAQTGSISIPAGTASPVAYTVSLNFSVPVGTALRLVTAAAAPALGYESSFSTAALMDGSTNVGSITNGYWGGASSYYYYFYNWKIGGAYCSPARTQVTATVTAAPALTTSGGQSICNGSASTPVTITAGAADYNTYSWTPATGVTGNSTSGWTFSPSATTAYTLNASQSTGSLCANTAVATITVKPVPTVDAGPDTHTCAGTGVQLAGTATVPVTNAFFTDFSSVAGWTANDYDAWAQWNSNDAGGVAPELGLAWYSGTSGTVNLWAQSPLIDGTQYGSLTLTFKHMVDWYQSNFNIYVETSPDGTTWTQRWTQNVTADVAATTVSVNLNAVAGQSFYVRYRYNAPFIRIDYWGIDDMKIAGTPSISYAWTPSSTLSAANIANPVASPAATTTYTMTGTVNGCSASDQIVVTADPLPSATITSASASLCYGNQLAVGGNVTATGAWTLTLSNGQTTTGTGNGTWSKNVTPGATTTYTITALTDAGCPGSSFTGSATATLPAVSTGLSVNESATCNVSGNNWVHFYSPSGKLIVSLNPNGNNLGSVTATSYVDGTPIMTQSCISASTVTAAMDRRWVVTPQFNQPAIIRLPFDNAELVDLQAAAATTSNPFDNISGINDLKLSKYSGAYQNGDWADNCIDGGTILIPTQGSNGAVTAANGFVNTLAATSFVQFSIPGFSEFWLHNTGSASPLPVELITFSADCAEHGNVPVRWATASEMNSDKFIVERSRDMNQWTAVSEHAAAGNSNYQVNYETMDQSAFGGVSYYRLVQIDYNGTQKIYGPISVTCGEEQNNMIVFPNPSNGNFTVEISSTEDLLNTEIQLTDLSGKVVDVQSLNIHQGKNQVLFSESLRKGVYIVKLVSRDGFVPVRVVID